MNILQINSSARQNGAFSSKLADTLVEKLLQSNSNSQLIVRDLAKTPHPQLDDETLRSLQTPAVERTQQQALRVALDEILIAEVQAANVLVLAAPMYNFGITSQLKNWIDAIARVGVTFRYDEHGAVGLLQEKKVYIILTRGGIHRGHAKDTMANYLSAALGFLGLHHIEFIYAEGLDMGEINQTQGIKQAVYEIEHIA